MTSQRKRLLQARKQYSECAHLIENRIKASGLSVVLSEQVIGAGVAADWLRRAAEMNEVEFAGKPLNNSEHKTSFVEQLRFAFSWFGLNAIFARPSLLSVFGSLANRSSEYKRFLMLYNSAALPNESAQLAELHDLLKKDTSPRMPGLTAGTKVSTINAIQAKYLQTPGFGYVGKQVDAAAQHGDFSGLTLPAIIYAFRNWSVHGAALDGSFGSRPGFVRYVEILQDVMAEVHYCVAQELMATI